MPRTMERKGRKHLCWMQWRTGYWGWWQGGVGALNFIQGQV